MTEKKQPTDRAGSVASGGAAALAGSEDPSPGPATEPAAAPSDLPKALSEQERARLKRAGVNGAYEENLAADRALTWIDAATELMAEQAAQVFLDGQRIAELERELQAERDRRVEHRQMNQSLNEQVQQFRTTVVSLTQDLEKERARVALALFCWCLCALAWGAVLEGR